jgi:uncharacterized protein with HEPN domain
MQHDPRAWLWDVRQAVDKIATFIEGRNFGDYLADAMVRSAVERQCEIIGEALNRLSQEAPELAGRIEVRRRAIAMRNILIHGYREVDDEAVWQTATEDLPALRAQLTALLTELGDRP